MLDVETQSAQQSPGQAEHEFAATVAHEMRTPLNVAAGFLSFLLQDMAGPLTVMQRDILASVATSLEQAQTLTEDLLCLSQMEHGQLRLNLQSLDLRAVLKDTVAQFSLMAQAANVRLEGHNLDGPALLTQADHQRLGQCLRNLIVNALKFSPMGQSVQVRLEEGENEYRIVVEDNGPGISPENLEAIFQRGFQEKNDLSRHLAGYGLGLSITKELIERQGGRIWVESTLGQGSRFWFSLPRL